MEKFIARHRTLVSSVLSGFDRVVLRGSLRALRHLGIYGFLQRADVRLLDFGKFAQALTERVKDAAWAEAGECGRPVVYLESPRTSKEALARDLLRQHPLAESGLICTFKAVEPCMRFEYHRSPERNDRGLRLRASKCLYIYHYYVHPDFGFMHLRLQTDLPFDVQVCLNGRAWLARQLRGHGVGFEQADNCLTRIEAPELAQQLLDEQLRTAWPATLDALRQRIHPLHEEIFHASPMNYWWVGYQTEWATDVLFRAAAALADRYPALVRHAVDHFKSPDVLRFLGRTERQAWKTAVAPASGSGARAHG